MVTEQRRVYSVSQLTREIKALLEMSFPRLWVEGEISNFKRHSSGHIYFTLKDEHSQIGCAIWRYRANSLIFEPQDGMKVIVEGELQVYEKGGYYQLIVFHIQPAGVGALQLAFEQLKQKLFQEGLFDEKYKKPIPAYPERIGVVTSPTGAAIRDIISVIHRRFPGVEIILYPVRVQGEGAAEEIAQAIRDFNEYGQVDVLIVGRGGGSLEDLWAFNEEIVARAIFDSHIPIISAVGHEIDFSFADFVADRRAPTPSAAAEMVVKERRILQLDIQNFLLRIRRAFLKQLQWSWERLHTVQGRYAFRKPEDMIYQRFQQLDNLQRDVILHMRHFLERYRNQAVNLQMRLRALNPNSIMKRGYSICYKDGKVVRRVDQLHVLDMVQVKLYRGQFLSQVQMIGEK